MEDKLDHANRFRKIMNIPLSYLKDLSALISRFSDVYERVREMDMSHIMRKPAFCICKNKGAD